MDQNLQQQYAGYGTPYNGISRPFQPPAPKMNQLLTQEEINLLKNRSGAFNINVDPIDLVRSRCTHKENNQFAIQDVGDGKVQCMICGETFTPVYDNAVEKAQRVIEDVGDIINTIKLVYVDMPTEMGNEFMPILELVRKVPALLKIALNNFGRYTNIMDQPIQGTGGFGNAFSNLNMITNGGYQMPMGGYGPWGYPQPQMGYGYYQQPQAPMYDPNQMQYAPGQPTPMAMANMSAPMTPTYGVPQNQGYPQPVPVQNNPFSMGYVPQQSPAGMPNSGFQFANPQAVPQAPAPTVPTAPQPYKPQAAVPAPPTASAVPVAPATGEVTVTETLHV